jgi:uncharacterized membrane-anchored protein
MNILNNILFVWAVVGGFAMYFLMTTADGMLKNANYKQIAFTLFACGPLGWIVGICVLVVAGIIYLYVKLGD